MNSDSTIDELAVWRAKRKAQALNAIQVNRGNLDIFMVDLLNAGFEPFEIRFHLVTIARWLKIGGTFRQYDGNFVTELMLDELIANRVFPSKPAPQTDEAIVLANHLLDSIPGLDQSC